MLDVTDSEISPDLVPELLVSDLAVSLGFWVEIVGFDISYDRPSEGFAYLVLGTAHVMLEQAGVGRNWIAAPLDRPLGRGMNLQISVPSTEPLLDRLAAQRWPLFMPPEHKTYRAGATEIDLTQFVVQDPDGYLLRFSSRRAATPSDSYVA
jgi:catechol 2,3-dioxygenase-like lactoylglutathione lyase family enzyme